MTIEIQDIIFINMRRNIGNGCIRLGEKMISANRLLGRGCCASAWTANRVIGRWIRPGYGHVKRGTPIPCGHELKITTVANGWIQRATWQ